MNNKFKIVKKHEKSRKKDKQQDEGKRNPSWWKEGESGNPNGRPPKGYSITEMFREMFDSDANMKIKLVAAIYNKACRGDAVAQKMIWAYMDGNPKDSIEVKWDGITAVPVTIAYIKPDKKKDETINTPDQHSNQTNP